MKILLSFITTVIVTSALEITLENPQCDTDWIYYKLTNSCYYQGNSLNFDAAEANCKNLGGHLASVHNAFENNFILQMVESGEQQSDSGMTWIGLRYANNRWDWTDGSDTSYVYWMSNMPDKMSKYACTELIQDAYKYDSTAKGKWQNVDCGTQMRKYICKKAPNY